MFDRQNSAMKTATSRVAAALVLMAAASGVQALDRLDPDPTGLWFDPAQPGWGLEVAQQGDTAFAVLFTYDANDKPAWYVASNLIQVASFNEVPATLSGTLYRTTGPAFSAATFDPGKVTATAVGNMQITYAAAGSPRQLALVYSINGAQVSKTLSAETWSASAQDLVGGYAGHFFVTPMPNQSAACPDPSLLLTQPIQPFQPYGFSITPGTQPNHVNVLWGSGVDLGCTADMTFQRDGQLASLDGNLQCGPIGFVPNGAAGVAISVRNLVLGQDGISGSATVQTTTPGGLTCGYTGEFGGVVTTAQSRSGMAPDPTGIWFNPAESGWGLALTQQGPNIFAALFAYDDNGNPTWWVASNVVDTGNFVNFLVGEAFAGPLFTTTATHSGNTFSLTALSVGTLQVANIGGTDKLALTYNVGSVTVQETVQRQSWSTTHPALVTGTYTGGLFPSTSACGSDGLFASTPATFTVTSDSPSSPVQIKWPTGPGTGCVLDADYVQTGQLATLSGPVHCGLIDDPQGAPGTITISQATVSSSGFSGFANFSRFANQDQPACTTGGFIGGVRH